MQETQATEHNEHGNDENGHDNLHIFVNRRKFEEGDGVMHRMSGAQIAALVGVPADNAIVRYDSGPLKGQEIPVAEVIEIRTGEHFLVTRRVVEGGVDFGKG